MGALPYLDTLEIIGPSQNPFKAAWHRGLRSLFSVVKWDFILKSNRQRRENIIESCCFYVRKRKMPLHPAR